MFPRHTTLSHVTQSKAIFRKKLINVRSERKDLIYFVSLQSLSGESKTEERCHNPTALTALGLTK
jgi:hypothetical protein